MPDPGSDAESDLEANPPIESNDETNASGDEPLNIAERMLACLGVWAGSLAGRWNPALGPFFTSDGRLAAGAETPLDMDVDDDPPPHLDG